MPGTTIISTARTPISKLSGAYVSMQAVDLGGMAIAAAIARSGIPPELIDAVVMGQVLQAGQGQITSRQAAARGGVPMSVPALTINKVCLSGIDAIRIAHLMIAAGEADIVVAGGMESMTNAPYLLPGARAGYRMGDAKVIDAMVHDGLWCAFDDVHMGTSTERDVAAAGLSRSEQDEWSARSHELAASATKAGRFSDEIAAVSIPQRRGDPLVIDVDEGIRPETTVESLAGLRPAFGAQGTVTAGNASQISDGACALVLASAAKAAELGIEPLAEIIGFGNVAGPGTGLLAQPANAIRAALSRANLQVSDMSLLEINEAFAAVAITSARELGLDAKTTAGIVNVNGGAIALGHPIGMSGARVVATLAHELKRRGGGLGAAALCGGGGQGEAAIIKVR